jgi:tetratricopeptide (TPR) repeat protein
LDGRPLSAREFQAALDLPHNARRVDHMKAHADDDFHLMACVPAAYLYMGAAEELGIELKPVLLPEHMFVRAQIDKNHWVNWDGNRGRSISDEDYIQGWGVQDWQVAKKIYMNPLSPDEIEGEMYTAIGVRLANYSGFGGYRSSIECYRNALRLNPRDPVATSNLALHLLYTPNPDSSVRDESLKLAQQGVELSPQESGSHLTLAYAWAAQGNTNAAVSEAKKAIDLDSKNDEARDTLPYIQAGYTVYDAFKARAPISFWVFNERGWIYVLIGVAIVGMSGVILLIRRRKSPRGSLEARLAPDLAAAEKS